MTQKPETQGETYVAMLERLRTYLPWSWDNYPTLCRKDHMRLIEWQSARIKELHAAMKYSVEIGCTDHLDCCTDAGAFWYDALAASAPDAVIGGSDGQR